MKAASAWATLGAKFQDNHRGNIVNKIFSSVGIGIAVGPDGTIYITEEFIQAQ